MLHKKSLKFLLTLLFSTHIFLQAENDKVEKEITSPLKSRFDVQLKKAPDQNRNLLIATAATCVASALTTYGITYALQIYKEQKEIQQQKDKIISLDKQVSDANATQDTRKNEELTKKTAETEALKKEIEDLKKEIEAEKTDKNEVFNTFLMTEGKEALSKFLDENYITALTILYNRVENKNLPKDHWRKSIEQIFNNLKMELPKQTPAPAKPADKDTTKKRKK